MSVQTFKKSILASNVQVFKFKYPARFLYSNFITRRKVQIESKELKNEMYILVRLSAMHPAHLVGSSHADRPLLKLRRIGISPFAYLPPLSGQRSLGSIVSCLVRRLSMYCTRIVAYVYTG